jgi:broad specificity phosphatase PhoE/ribonuclease HI
MRRVVVEADGGSRGNPGPAGYGAVVFDADSGEVLAERKGSIGIDTNNVAEYRGLIAGLQAAAELGAATVTVQMDSKLVVEQMSGRWQIKHPSMRPLARQAAELALAFGEISYTWIPRERNNHADRLANEAMDGVATPTPQTGWVPPDSTPTRLILLRHGVTEHTLAKRFAGRSDLALAPQGREQAERAADRLLRLGDIDVLLSSPLLRTRQTALPISTRTGLDVLPHDGFVETDFGDWDGHTYAEVAEKWPTELTAWQSDTAVAPPGGESFDEVTDRVRTARDEVLQAYPGKTVVVVSHVSPIKILVRLALDAPPSALYRMFLSPASISVIDYFAEGPATLRGFNDAG